MTLAREAFEKLDIKSGDILLIRGDVSSKEIDELCDLLRLAGVENVSGFLFAHDATISPLRLMGEHNHEAYNRLQPHQQRVVVEKLELDDKLIKLRNFLETDRFKGLDPAEQDRMHAQANAMARYSGVLADRIAAFGGEQ